jgi:hypothetical protein
MRIGSKTKLRIPNGANDEGEWVGVDEGGVGK